MTLEKKGRDHEKAVVGLLVGMAVGDALGLPFEGLSRQRQKRLAPEITGHRLFLRYVMVSDDTEHACMVAQAVVASGGVHDQFIRSLSWRLRFWLLGLPAGVGMATLRSIIKLWLGFGWRHSGVFSAGNGPAMRSPVLGVLYANDPVRCHALVERSTRLTHTDPKAMDGAIVVAVAAGLAAELGDAVRPDVFRDRCRETLGSDDSEIMGLVTGVVKSVDAGETTERFAEKLGLGEGVSGYMYHTVPIVLHAWLRFPADFQNAVSSVIVCGGDTDTTAAIVGGIVGAAVGPSGIPEHWRKGVIGWPCSLQWIARLGESAATVVEQGRPGTPLRASVLGRLVRNLVFAAIVIAHGFRRLLPPY